MRKAKWKEEFHQDTTEGYWIKDIEEEELDFDNSVWGKRNRYQKNICFVEGCYAFIWPYKDLSLVITSRLSLLRLKFQFKFYSNFTNSNADID